MPTLARRPAGKTKLLVVVSPTCRHCHAGPAVVRRRGLCDRCYHDPTIRRHYAKVTPRRANRQPDCYRVAPIPDEPTAALPGSKAKMKVMRLRLAKRQRLQHPGDARMPS